MLRGNVIRREDGRGGMGRRGKSIIRVVRLSKFPTGLTRDECICFVWWLEMMLEEDVSARKINCGPCRRAIPTYSGCHGSCDPPIHTRIRDDTAGRRTGCPMATADSLLDSPGDPRAKAGSRSLQGWRSSLLGSGTAVVCATRWQTACCGSLTSVFRLID